MATSEFSVFSTAPGAYVLPPATWAADPVRQSGFPPGLLPKEKLNTPLRQASSIATMLANFMAANQGDNVLDDGDLTTLQQQFQAALLAFTSTQSTHYQLASPDGLSASRNVVLTPGTWQMVIVSYMNFVDPGNYDFVGSRIASVVGSLVNMSANATARIVRGGGAGFGRSVFPVLAAVNQMTVVAPETFSMTINNFSPVVGFVTHTGAVLTLDKIG